MKISKLKTQRKKAGLTQKEIAITAQINERLYQRYEAEECLPNVQTAIKIAQALNSTCEELFSQE